MRMLTLLMLTIILAAGQAHAAADQAARAKLREEARQKRAAKREELAAAAKERAAKRAAAGAERVARAGTWHVERTGTGRAGQGWTSTSDVRSTPTVGGRTWHGEGSGSADNGRTWNTVADGSRVRTGDGTASIEASSTRTFDDGQTVDKTRQTLVTKTEDGKTWQSTEIRVGPKGTATITGTGTAAKTADGATWEVEREGSGPNDKTWQSTTEGTTTWQGNTRTRQSTTDGVTGGGRTWTAARSSQGAWTPDE